MTLGGTIAGVFLAFFLSGHHAGGPDARSCALLRHGDPPPEITAPLNPACRDLARLARAANEAQARARGARLPPVARRPLNDRPAPNPTHPPVAAMRGWASPSACGLTPGLSAAADMKSGGTPSTLLHAAACLLRVGRQPVDAVHAHRLLDVALARDPGLPGALALKGALLWWGKGIPPDRRQARRLFRRAALELAARDLEGLHADPARREFSAAHFRTLLLAELGGPWPVSWPRPLERMFAWLAKRHAAGARGLLMVAERLRRGAWGLPPDPVLAFAWTERAALVFGGPEAHYVYALALRDPDLFRRRAQDPRQGAVGDFAVAAGLANVHLVEAARTGYRPAMVTVVRLLQCAPDYPQKTFALHYWASRLARAGYAPAKALRTRTAGALSAEDRHDAEHWPDADPPPFTLPFLPRAAGC